jgi:hypothetical protein
MLSWAVPGIGFLLVFVIGWSEPIGATQEEDARFLIWMEVTANSGGGDVTT